MCFVWTQQIVTMRHSNINVAASFMELDTTYKMINMRNKRTVTSSYIDCLRNKFLDIREDLREEAEQFELDNAMLEVASDDSDHDDEDDNDYVVDIPDLGRDALIDLLKAAVIQDGIDEDV